LEKKNQKTFASLYTGCCNVPREQKLFGGFPQKSGRFLSLESPKTAAQRPLARAKPFQRIVQESGAMTISSIAV